MGDRATLLFTTEYDELPLVGLYTHSHATTLEEVLKPIVQTCFIEYYDHKSDSSWSLVVMRIIEELREKLGDDLEFFPPSLILEGKPYDAHHRYTIGPNKHHITVFKYINTAPVLQARQMIKEVLG